VVALITHPRVVAVAEPQAEQDSIPTRLPAWVVVPSGVAIAGASAFLRLWQLNALGFNSDEAVYAGQAAAIAGDPALKGIFPVFRAHPLLFQFVLAVLFRGSSRDLVARLLAVAFGLTTVYLVYRLGSLLYGQAVGLLAAALLAVCPYHVVVTRQALLDGALTFFATLTAFLLAKYATTGFPPKLAARRLRSEALDRMRSCPMSDT